MGRGSSSSLRHITWENFLGNFVNRGDDAVHPIPGGPACRLFVEKGGERIGLRIACDDVTGFPALPFSHIQADVVHLDGKQWLRVVCDNKAVFEPFYAMLLGISDLVQIDGVQPVIALRKGAETFNDLFQPIPILSEEKQVGLWCELWVLDQIIDDKGVKGVEQWIGPLKEPHDFRIGLKELEIKGTRKEIRSHVISSMSQLVPSPDRSLYLVSIQLGLAGDTGTSLPRMVGNIRIKLQTSQSAAEKFDSRLESAGYIETHDHFYAQEYQLRSIPRIIPVNDEVARITPKLLENSLGESLASRIDDVQYTVDVTGLGAEWRTSIFN